MSAETPTAAFVAAYIEQAKSRSAIQAMTHCYEAAFFLARAARPIPELTWRWCGGSWYAAAEGDRFRVSASRRFGTVIRISGQATVLGCELMMVDTMKAAMVFAERRFRDACRARRKADPRRAALHASAAVKHLRVVQG